MKYFSKQKGFTLIELLVVIAIIAILITIVIANVGSARGRARVVAAKATLKQVQVQAELDGYACDGQVLALIESAVEKVGGDPATDYSCVEGPNGLAVSITEAFTAGGFPNETFCVDTNGFSAAGEADPDTALCVAV